MNISEKLEAHSRESKKMRAPRRKFWFWMGLAATAAYALAGLFTVWVLRG